MDLYRQAFEKQVIVVKTGRYGRFLALWSIFKTAFLMGNAKKVLSIFDRLLYNTKQIRRTVPEQLPSQRSDICEHTNFLFP